MLPKSSGSGSSHQRAEASCDQCRERKVRCIPFAQSPDVNGPDGRAGLSSSASPCGPCHRRRERCTFEYTRKKPGRRKGCQNAARSGRSSSSPSLPPALASYQDSSSRHLPPPAQTVSTFGGQSNVSAERTVNSFDSLYTTPASTSNTDISPMNGSNQSSCNPAPSTSQNIAPNPYQYDNAPFNVHLAPVNNHLGPPSISQPPLTTVNWPADMTSPDSTFDQAVGGLNSRLALHTKVDHIEQIASWADIGFFLSLHLRYQHALVPLVHKPTFAQDILNRRDENDEAFRALLLSIVAYTICQCPAHLLLGRMDRSGLESTLRRCQRASRVIQIYHQTRPTLTILVSTILDWITCQGTRSNHQVRLSPDRPENLMSDIRRLVYTLGLHRKEPAEGMSILDLEMSRRVYWEAYAIDKTNALNGYPMALHDAEGTPPMPSEVDDEYITELGTGFQPVGSISLIVGYNAVTQIFRLMSQCLWRHRTWVVSPSEALETATLLAWIPNAMGQIQQLLAGLPSCLRPECNVGLQSTGPYGTQVANIYITALCTELALLDLKSSLLPGTDLGKERKAAVQRGFKELEKVPLERLASNGESMRGKVLRVLLVLLNVEDEGDALSEHVKEWFDIYSRVQFIQVIPEIPASNVPTRPHTPEAA